MSPRWAASRQSSASSAKTPPASTSSTATGEAPPAEEDWLLDIRLYSAEFHADVASIWLQELGLQGLYLRDHLKARSAFLGNQERRKKLKRLITPEDDEAALDLKMMAVLVGSASRKPLRRASCALPRSRAGWPPLRSERDAPRPSRPSRRWTCSTRFWEMMRGEFGYASDNPQRGRPLAQALCLGAFSPNRMVQSIDSLAHFALPAAGTRNAVVFLTQWRDSSGDAASYDAAAAAVGNRAESRRALGVARPRDHQGCLHLLGRREARRLQPQGARTERDATRSTSSRRSTRHASGRRGTGSPGPAATRPSASGHRRRLRRHRRGRRALRAAQPSTGKPCRFDDARRSFSPPTRTNSIASISSTGASARKPGRPRAQGWDLLKTLAEEVERGLRPRLLAAAGRRVEPAARRRVSWSEWSLDGSARSAGLLRRSTSARTSPSRSASAPSSSSAMPFATKPRRSSPSRSTAATGWTPSCRPCWACCPPTPRSGMASLLPHKTLGYNDKGEVLVDGQSTAGTEARNKQLGTRRRHGVPGEGPALR